MLGNLSEREWCWRLALSCCLLCMQIGCSLVFPGQGPPHQDLDDTWTIREANGHAYRAEERTTWHDGQGLCEGFGGHLATLSDVLEEAFVVNLAGGDTNGIYVGFFCEGTCEWIDETPFEGSRWGSGHPEDGLGPCGEVYQGLWYSSPCGQSLGVVCEID